MSYLDRPEPEVDGGVTSGLHMDPLVITSITPVPPSKTTHPLRPDFRIPFDGDVDDARVQRVLKAVNAQVAMGYKVIILDINSNGGDVDAGLDFIRALDDVRARDVHVTCVVHRAQSMAGFILEGVCDTRLILDYGRIMFHHAHAGGVERNADQMENLAVELRVLDSALAARVLKRLRITKKEYYQRIYLHDWFMDAQEALAVGAVDKIIPDVSHLPPLLVLPAE